MLAGRSEIASVIAHDVRGPASSIKSIAASTRTNYDRLGDAERLEFVGMIEHEAARLLQLVGQMSLALKVDAGSLEYQRRVQPVGPIVSQAINDAELTEHAIEVDVSDPADADVDARWLAEAIGQGLDNAAKFSPDGSPVRIMMLTDRDDVVIQMADEGPPLGPILATAVHEAEITERAVDVDVSADADADVDARWLAEAIGQGLDNATKFSPDGAPVRLMLLDDGSDAVIQIADAGPGVPPEVREEVFEKFARWRPPGLRGPAGERARAVHHAEHRARARRRRRSRLGGERRYHPADPDPQEGLTRGREGNRSRCCCATTTRC